MMLLRHHSERHGLHILGWCLMTNHVHIVAIPEYGAEGTGT
jgi:REP element-mobilizing transposase RayT